MIRSFFDYINIFFFASEGKWQVFDIDIEEALAVEVGEKVGKGILREF